LDPNQPVPPTPKKSGKWLPGLIVASAGGCGCLILIPILAAIAIPAFTGYVRRSKASEATAELKTLFRGAASYYDAEHNLPDGTLGTFCTVEPAITANVPGEESQAVDLGPGRASFEALEFVGMDRLYFRYEIDGSPARCGWEPNQSVYSFRAQGDLDGDGNLSLYEMAVGSDSDNRIYRAPGFYVTNELE